MGVASIESNLERIATALERIAASLETHSAPQGIQDTHPAPVSLQEADLALFPPATYEEAQAAVMALIGRKNHEAAKAVLSTFKVKFVKDLDSSKYGAVVAACKDA